MLPRHIPGGGGYMTCGWTGVCCPVSKRYPLLITESYRHAHFYDEFWRKTTHFLLFFTNFWITHPCLRKICRKRDPCLENLGPENPPIWAAHTRTLNILCTPPPGAHTTKMRVFTKSEGENDKKLHTQTT